jgi:hypothetical protein
MTKRKKRIKQNQIAKAGTLQVVPDKLLHRKINDQKMCAHSPGLRPITLILTCAAWYVRKESFHLAHPSTHEPVLIESY